MSLSASFTASLQAAESGTLSIKKDLICAHSQQIADERLAFCRRRFGKTAQDIIQLNPPLRHAFGQPFDKGLITAFQVIIFIQYILKKKAAILLPFFPFPIKYPAQGLWCLFRFPSSYVLQSFQLPPDFQTGFSRGFFSRRPAGTDEEAAE